MSNIKDTQTNQIVNKGKGAIVKVLARLTATGIISFGIGGAVTFDRYNSYWNQTIFRVQTVDFNILSHTLPTKLSYALIKQQPQEVQRTLDSNYNLFGLIVTDSSGQKIIAYSGKDSGRFLSWKAALDPQQLKNHPYDVLLDPPPVFAQWTYSNSRATERSATNFTNQGRVIGRVYYVRGVRPTFQEDLITLLSDPFSGSSRIQTYTTSLAACFGATLLIWSGLEFMLYKRRVDKETTDKEKQELIDNNQILQVQLAERINELQFFQKQRDNERNEFEKEANDLRISNEKLETEIVTLTNSIKTLSANANLVQLQNELQEAQTQSKENLKQKQQYENHIKQHENHIKQLTQKLQVIHNQQLQASQQNEQKDHDLQELQQQINEIEDARNLAKSQLEELHRNEKNYQELVERLEQQINQQNFRERELQTQLESLQNSLTEYQQREQLLEQRAKQAKDESHRLAEEMERYIEETDKHPLNDFEIAIQTLLKQHFTDTKLETQFDVASGQQGSRFTDFLLITNKSCIVLEAKSYTGIIKPIDNVRNSGWVCEKVGRKLNILSCWGRNPYQQVKSYCDSVMSNKSLGISKKPVYGVVVFPEGSCIDDSIPSNISRFYRVTTLDNLANTIQELENQANSWN